MRKPKVSVIIPVYNNALYLNETLESLRKQTLKEFEAIVINDGSVDESEIIIDRFVEKDPRFLKISQENQGVSAARNAGLCAAKGIYITFADGDDMLPENSLEEMAKTAEKEQSDLVIGGIQRVDGFTKKVNQRTKKLKDKPVIQKDDLDLVHGLSLCNKWFLKEIIDANRLRLEHFRHLEDAVFLYNFLQYAEKISYCDVIVYNYLKRVPTVTGSVTQRVEKGLLESALKAYERLKELTKDYSEEFKQELDYRINSTTLIGDYYKKIWYLDEETEKLLLSSVKEIWKKQSAEHKRRTIVSHPGLGIEKGFRTREELLKDNIFTIVLTSKLSKDRINLILRSIYGQAVPAVRIIVDEQFAAYIDDSFKKMKNLFWEKTDEYTKQFEKKGYCMFLEEDVIFDYDTLAVAYRLFQNKKCDVVRIRIIRADRKVKKTGIIFDGKRTGENLKSVTQSEAPLLMIRDLDQIMELTKPTFFFSMKRKIKRLLKKIYKKLRSLL